MTTFKPLIALWIFLAAAGLHAQTARRGTFEFGPADGNTNVPLKVWYYRPAEISPATRIVFVIHGGSRKGHEVRDVGAAQVKNQDVVVLAPEIPEEVLGDDAYSFGNMADKRQRLLPQSQWLFTTIEQLFDYARQRLGLATEQYDIFGHSAGGQFVHRMVLFVPEARFRRAVASGCGRYAMPTLRIRFPYGLGGTSVDGPRLAQAFGRDFVLLLGDQDTLDRERESAARAQGENRFARGLRFFAEATEEANNLGVPLAWRLRILHGVAHSLDAATKAGFEELSR